MKRRLCWIFALVSLLVLFLNMGGRNALTQGADAAELLAAPEKPYKIVNVVSGVHVYWNQVSGAQKYGIWRSETGKDGNYKWLGNPTVPHFTDTKVESGKTYFYKVSSVNEEGEHSELSAPIGINYVSTPDITARFNKAAGISLGWDQIEGATGYAIYRKSYSGGDDWARIATIEGNSTFTWIDASVKNSNGVAYKYTIRALAGSDMKTLSGCRNAGRSMVRLTSRALNDAYAVDEHSIKCSWTTSSAVSGYEVRFMVGGNVYKTVTVGNYKTGTKTFGNLDTWNTYKIQVRSYVKIDGMGFYSAWSTAKEVTLECMHEWVEATCKEASYCTKCGNVEGEPLGHTTVDGMCDRCGKSIKPHDLCSLVLPELPKNLTYTKVFGSSIHQSGSFTITDVEYRFTDAGNGRANLTVTIYGTCTYAYKDGRMLHYLGKINGAGSYTEEGGFSAYNGDNFSDSIYFYKIEPGEYTLTFERSTD